MLIGSIVGPKQANVYLNPTKVHSVLSLLTNFYLATLASLLALFFVKTNIITAWSDNNLVELSAIIVGALFVLRIIFASLHYLFYFMSYSYSEDFIREVKPSKQIKSNQKSILKSGS